MPPSRANAGVPSRLPLAVISFTPAEYSFFDISAVRAQRLVAWLAPLAAELGRPLRDLALQPARQLALARERQLATLDPASLRRYGLVPLELSGRQGTFRIALAGEPRGSFHQPK